MPPANTSFALATNIPSLPFDFTQTDINDAGVNFTVYYKFIAPTNSVVIGALGINTGYVANIRLYLGPAGAPTLLNPPSVVAEVPVISAVTPGSEYFIEFQKQANTPGPCSLRVLVEVAPQLNTPVGSIMTPIPSNILPFPQQDILPMAIVSATAPDVVFKLTRPIVSDTELGDIHSNGVFILADNSGNANTVVLYNPDFTVLSTLTIAGTVGLLSVRRCTGQNKFYVLTTSSPAALRDVLPTGVFGSVNMTLTASGFMNSGAVSNDGTILYYYGSVRGQGLRRWDLVGNVGLGVFTASTPDYVADDILVLSNGTIVASWTDTTFSPFIRSFDAAGTTIQTYPIGAIDVFSHHCFLARDLDDPNFFWSKHDTNVASVVTSHFKKWNTTTGAVALSLDYTHPYASGFDQQPGPATSIRFGPGYSVPFFLLTSTLYKGIYVFEPNKTSDTVNNNGTLLDVAIPNPTFKTGLLG